jgi:uncharacterized membrane protein
MNEATYTLWRMLGRVLIVVWFVLGGIGHFVITNTFISVVPPYVPFPLEMVYFTGVCEIAGGLAVLYKPLRHIAGWCLIALAICVTPVHIQMLIEADKYQALGPLVLWGRLLFQPVLLWIIRTTSGASVTDGMRSIMIGQAIPPRRSRRTLSTRDSPMPSAPPRSIARATSGRPPVALVTPKTDTPPADTRPTIVRVFSAMASRSMAMVGTGMG